MKRWESWEISTLKEKYPVFGSKISELKHRTRKQIQMKAWWLGVKYQGLPKELLEELYIENDMSSNEIASFLGCSGVHVLEHLRKYSIERKGSTYFNLNKRVNLSKDEMDVIKGCVLGDGCLANNKSGKNCQFIYASEHGEIINHLRNILSDKIFTENWLRTQAYNDGRCCTYYLKTRYLPNFKELYSMFYPNGQKTIPDIRFNPKIMLYWYLGDGRISTKSYYCDITSCFTKGEYEKAINYLSSKGIKVDWVNFPSNCISSSEKGFIKIYGKNNVARFLNLIGKPPVKCLKYRWGGFY